MFIVYCILILLGIYVAVSKSVDSSVKTFIIVGDVVLLVLLIVLEVLGG